MTDGERILTLADGKPFDVRYPDARTIAIETFAEHIAKEARFNGATPLTVYSVAEHSVLVCDRVLQLTGSRLAAAYGLMHDLKEGGIKDDPTPKKRGIAQEIQAKCGVTAGAILDCLAALEDRHDVAHHAAAGLDWPPPPEIAAAVKRADRELFKTEWVHLMRDPVTGRVFDCPCWDDYADVEPLDINLLCLPFDEAMRLFLVTAQAFLPVYERRRDDAITSVFPVLRLLAERRKVRLLDLRRAVLEDQIDREGGR
jgi:hypothetical protein